MICYMVSWLIVALSVCFHYTMVVFFGLCLSMVPGLISKFICDWYFGDYGDYDIIL